MLKSLLVVGIVQRPDDIQFFLCSQVKVQRRFGVLTLGHIFEDQLAKGKALGQFRSSGQLGRAIGPLLGKSFDRLFSDLFTDSHVACVSYWTFGPSLTYTISAIAMTALSIRMRRIAATKSS